MTAVSDYESAIDSLITAVSDEDGAAVRRLAAIARLRAAKLPRVSGDGESISYDEAMEAIDGALADYDASQSQGGMIRTPMEAG